MQVNLDVQALWDTALAAYRRGDFNEAFEKIQKVALIAIEQKVKLQDVINELRGRFTKYEKDHAIDVELIKKLTETYQLLVEENGALRERVGKLEHQGDLKQVEIMKSKIASDSNAKAGFGLASAIAGFALSFTGPVGWVIGGGLLALGGFSIALLGSDIEQNQEMAEIEYFVTQGDSLDTAKKKVDEKWHEVKKLVQGYTAKYLMDGQRLSYPEARRRVFAH